MAWLLGGWWLVGLAMAGPTPVPPAPSGPVVETDDGWRLPVRRFEADGPPVVMLHGLSGTWRTFDLMHSRSLARTLQADGWDVWVITLRGDRDTEAPAGVKPGRWGFDDHLHQDLPAVLDRIEAETGHGAVAWVGHSMGGMLMYGLLRDRPERIAVGVAIASPAAFDHPLRSHRNPKRWRGEGVVGVEGIARFAASAGLWELLESRLAAEGSLGEQAALGIGWHLANDATRRQMRLASRWVRTGIVQDETGTPLVADADVPVLVMGGPADATVSWHDIRHACDVLTRCTWVPLSRANGMSHDYGHTDPVVGRAAPLEVFPAVRDFLARHRPALQGDGPAASE